MAGQGGIWNRAENYQAEIFIFEKDSGTLQTKANNLRFLIHAPIQ